MFARLAFSVSINVEPDILIIDEALSVGDMAFQMKCFKKFQDFQKEGRTILFVTHALETVIRYCSRGIVIDDGHKIFDGTSKEAVDVFKKLLTGNFYQAEQPEHKITAPACESNALIKDSFPKPGELIEYGNRHALIYDYGLIDANGNPTSLLEHNALCTIVMKVQFDQQIIAPIFAFSIKDAKGLEITGTNTMMKRIDTDSYGEGDQAAIRFKQRINLRSGGYSLSFGCVSIGKEGIEVYHRLYDAILFEVISSEEMGGFFDLGSAIEIN